MLCSQDVFCQSVINTVVLTAYNNNTYTIDDVDFNTTPATQFTLKNNEKITYIEYYRKKYGRDIKNPKQPMLVTKSKVRVRQGGPPELIYLVPELCNATGNSLQNLVLSALFKSVFIPYSSFKESICVFRNFFSSVLYNKKKLFLV